MQASKNMSLSVCVFTLLSFSTPALSSIAYTTVSVTKDDLSPCLSSCTSSGKCYVDQHLNEEDCYVDHSAGVPTYFVVERAVPKVPYSCLSNCGKFGSENYNWCYTTENYDWDYCNPHVYSPSEQWGRGIYGVPCLRECRFYDSSTSTCPINYRDAVQCARPARVDVQSCMNIFTTTGPSRHPRSPYDSIFSATCSTALCRSRVRDGRPGETATRRQTVLTQSNSGAYPVERIVQFPPGSPYTFVATRNETNSNGDMVYLPLVVEATLRRPAALPQRTSDDVPYEATVNTANMYDGDASGRDTGHLVAFINGGTRDLFNFVSQTRATNRGPYKVIETFINNWINSGLGYADFTVVVDYIGTTVKEFAVKLILYNNDGSVHSDCLDMIIANI